MTAVQMAIQGQDPYSAIRQGLREVVEQGAQVTRLAKMIGKSHSALSRFMNDPTYGSAGLAAEIERLLIQLKSAEMPIPEIAEDGWVKTADALTVLGICHLAREERRLAVVVGPAGAGKTTGLQRYKQLHPDVTVYIRANPLQSLAGLAIKIGDQIGLSLRNGMSLDSMLDAIVQELRHRPRVILVDEADYLTSGSLRRMEILRTVLDESGCGMVLAGMPRLLEILTRGPSLKENLAQFYSRVTYLRELQGLTEDEVRAFCQARGAALTEAALRELVRRANDRHFGGARRVVNILTRAAKLAKGGTIDINDVRDADELELRR